MIALTTLLTRTVLNVFQTGFVKNTVAPRPYVAVHASNETFHQTNLWCE